MSAAWKGAKITQPSFFIAGKVDGLEQLYPPAGHWVQHEASAEVSDQLVNFLRTVNPA
jgi:pimeloyl-ACP methyl ester carboxylesterase